MKLEGRGASEHRVHVSITAANPLIAASDASRELACFEALPLSKRELRIRSPSEVLALDNAYRFLRRVEHRLQIEAEQQTHTVPDEPEALQRLALSLRFSSADEFTAALHARMATVRPIFERIISETPAESTTTTL